MSHRWSAVGCMTALAIMASGPATVRAGFVIQDLGVIYATGTSGALGINASGGTAGMVTQAGSQMVAASSQAGGMLQKVTGLSFTGSSVANAINGAGGVAGMGSASNSSTQTGFYTASAGGAVTLISPLSYQGTSGTTTQATGINDAGQVVGTGNLGTIPNRAFVMTGGSVTLIPPLGGGNPGTSALSNWANGINNSGMVVGTSEVVQNGLREAFYTNAGGVPTAVTNSGTFQGNTYGMAIANDGDVVGYGDVGGSEQAFYAAGGSGPIIALGTLAGSASSKALGVNDNALVVGTSGGQAFLYGNSMMYNLNSLISPTNSTSWNLTEATGINDSDQISGEGYLNGVLHGFVLTPIPGQPIFVQPAAVPAPPTLVLSAIGLACGLCRRLRRFKRVRTEVREAA